MGWGILGDIADWVGDRVEDIGDGIYGFGKTVVNAHNKFWSQAGDGAVACWEYMTGQDTENTRIINEAGGLLNTWGLGTYDVLTGRDIKGETDLMLNLDKLELLLETLQTIRIREVEQGREACREKLRALNNVKGLNKYVVGINENTCDEVFDNISQYIADIITQINAKAGAIIEFNDASTADKILATVAAPLGRFSENALSLMEHAIGDPLAIFSAKALDFVGFDGASKSLSNFAAKELVHDAYHSESAQHVYNISFTTENGLLGKIDQVTGTLAGAFIITGGMAAHANPSMTAAQFFKPNPMGLSIMAKESVKMQGLAGFGSGTTSALREGKSLDAAMGTGVNTAIKQAGTTAVLSWTFENGATAIRAARVYRANAKANAAAGTQGNTGGIPQQTGGAGTTSSGTGAQGATPTGNGGIPQQTGGAGTTSSGAGVQGATPTGNGGIPQQTGGAGTTSSGAGVQGAAPTGTGGAGTLSDQIDDALIGKPASSAGAPTSSDSIFNELDDMVENGSAKVVNDGAGDLYYPSDSSAVSDAAGGADGATAGARSGPAEPYDTTGLTRKEIGIQDGRLTRIDNRLRQAEQDLDSLRAAGASADDIAAAEAKVQQLTDKYIETSKSVDQVISDIKNSRAGTPTSGTSTAANQFNAEAYHMTQEGFDELVAEGFEPGTSAWNDELIRTGMGDPLPTSATGSGAGTTASGAGSTAGGSGVIPQQTGGAGTTASGAGTQGATATGSGSAIPQQTGGAGTTASGTGTQGLAPTVTRTPSSPGPSAVRTDTVNTSIIDKAKDVLKGTGTKIVNAGSSLKGALGTTATIAGGLTAQTGQGLIQGAIINPGGTTLNVLGALTREGQDKDLTLPGLQPFTKTGDTSPETEPDTVAPTSPVPPTVAPTQPIPTDPPTDPPTGPMPPTQTPVRPVPRTETPTTPTPITDVPTIPPTEAPTMVPITDAPTTPPTNGGVPTSPRIGTEPRTITTNPPTEGPKPSNPEPPHKEEPYYPGGGYDDTGYTGEVTKDLEEVDIEDLLTDDVIKGGRYSKIPTSSIPITNKVNTKNGSSVVPIIAGLSAAAAAGIGAKAYMDRKNNRDNGEDDDYSDESWSEGDGIELNENVEINNNSENYLDDDDYGYQAVETEKYGARTNEDLADLQ